MVNFLNFADQLRMIPQDLPPRINERLRLECAFYTTEMSCSDHYIAKNHDSDFTSYERSLQSQRSDFAEIEEAEIEMQKILRKIKYLSEKDMHRIFRMTIQHVYECVPLDRPSVVVTTKILPDGSGDYFQMLLTAKIMKEAFPFARVSVAALLPEDRLLESPSENIEDLSYRNEHEMIQKQVVEKFNQADLVISIPVSYKSTFVRTDQKQIKISEYGNSYIRDVLFPIYSMGLFPFHFVLGIPLKQPSYAPSIEALPDSSLKGLLLQEQRPFYFSYLKIIEESPDVNYHSLAFVIAAVASCVNQDVNLNIITTLDRFEENSSFISVLKTMNIGRLIFLKCHKNLSLLANIKIQEKGREVRLLNPFPLPNESIMILQKFCQPLVGCTGDMSFTETISNKKIPFYQIITHKQTFFDQLETMTGEIYLEKFPRLNTYFRKLREICLTGCIVSSKKRYYKMSRLLGEGCREIELLKEMELFSNLIEKHYCFNPLLVDIAKRKLVHQRFPELKILEKTIRQRWISEKTSSLSDVFSIFRINLEEFVSQISRDLLAS